MRALFLALAILGTASVGGCAVYTPAPRYVTYAPAPAAVVIEPGYYHRHYW